MSVQGKVFSEIVGRPSVVVPIAIGVACIAGSAVVGSAALAVTGAVCLIGGVSWMVGRAFWKLEDITATAAKYERGETLKSEDDRLSSLLAKLRMDRDFRTKDFLTQLREGRNEFERMANQPKMQARTFEIVSQVRDLFWNAVSQLERSYTLFEFAERASGDRRKEILAEREQVLGEVKMSADKISRSVDQFRKMQNGSSDADLVSMRDDLDLSLKVAAKTEERMKEFEEGRTPDPLRE